MGSRNIKGRASAVLAALGLAFGCTLLAGAPHVSAQSFGGMSMLDLEADRDDFFQSADSDGDFALSTDEQLSAIGKHNAGLYECWDSDGDGVCSYSEFLDSGQKVFDELDRNGDGQLTQDEVP